MCNCVVPTGPPNPSIVPPHSPPQGSIPIGPASHPGPGGMPPGGPGSMGPGPGAMPPGGPISPGEPPSMALPFSILNEVCASGQSMVFNSQNPNTPSICSCGICRKEVHNNNQTILCKSGSNYWFHQTCRGLQETAITRKRSQNGSVTCSSVGRRYVPFFKFKPQ